MAEIIKTIFFFSVALMASLLASPAAAAPDVFDNVPEASGEGYLLVYTLPIPDTADFNAAGSVPYTVDNTASITGPFDRIAYYLELDSGNGLVYAYVSMDAFTNDINRVGIPIASSGVTIQQLVANMNIVSNDPSITTGNGISTGNVEFWPNNYGTNNQVNVPNASNDNYDFGDLRATSGNYGSFQIHNHGASQTIIGYNRWGGIDPASNCDLGIGNSPNATLPDWTFASNANTYTIKNLQILVRPAGLSIDNSLQRAIFQRDIHHQASIPITGQVTSGITSIEARVIPRAGSGGVATGWKTIVQNPAAGSYSGQLAIREGWYDLEVRSLTGITVVDQRSVQRVGVGDVYIVAGQSNSANHGSDLLSPNDDRVSAFDLSEWQFAADPQPIATGSGGSPWPSLGDSLAIEHDIPIGFVTVGWGGTSVGQWVPGAAGPDTQPLYERLKSALQAVGPDGARAVLWHQGETDNILGTTTSHYVQSLESIIVQSRIDAGFEIPWGIAQATFVPPDIISQNVLNAQSQVATNDPLNFLGPYTDNLTGPTWRAPDQIHFNEAGLIEHANRWQTAINTFFQDVLVSVDPEASKLLDGVLVGGQLADLVSSDDVDMMLDPSPTKNPKKQIVELILISETSIQLPTSFGFCLEGSMLGGQSGDVIQSVGIWNFVDSDWDLLDTRAVATSDEELVFQTNGQPGDYVHPLTGEVIAKLKWASPSFTSGAFTWSIDLDQAIWLVGD